MDSAVYPGSFDPLTYGHIDVIQRARKIVRTLVVAVAEEPPKQTTFTADERLSMVKEAITDLEGVTFGSFQGLLVDYARNIRAQAIIRGLRALSDFEYEFQMALTNRKLCGTIETVFLMPSETHSYLSSTMIKQVARFGGDLSAFVPPFVRKMFDKKFAK